MKKLFLVILTVFVSFYSNSQTIWKNDITGTNPNTSNPYTIGDVVNSNVTVSGIGRGSGLLGNNANNRYNARDWTSATSLDANDYFEFTITPTSPNKVDFGNFIFDLQTSQNNAPTTFELRYSTDGTNFNLIGSATTINLNSTVQYTYDLSTSTFQDIYSAITFRIYGYNAASGGAGTLSVNNFQFNGKAGNPLPVTFGSINALKTGNQLRVNWTTLTERDNSYFDIQASNDGKTFKTIGVVHSIAVEGISSSPLHYEFEADYNNLALFGIPAVLGLLALGFTKKNRAAHSIIAFFVLVTTIVACTKSDAISTEKTNKLFVKIVQHSANGDTQSSKVVQVVNY